MCGCAAKGLTRLTTPYVPGPDNDLPYRRSPIYALVRDGQTQRHWRLDRGEGCADIPAARRSSAPRMPPPTSCTSSASAARSLRPCPVWPSPSPPIGPAASPNPTSRASYAVMPAVGLASYRYMLARVSSAILGVYLGERTARRVLAGEVRRGTGRAIEAAILLADLRGFTSLAGREPPARVVAWLDEHLEAIGEAGRGAGWRGAEVPRRRPARGVPRRGGHRRPRRCLPARARRCRAGAGRDRRAQCAPPATRASRELGARPRPALRRGGLRQCRRRPPPRLHRDRPDRQRGQPHRGAVRRAWPAPPAVGALRRPLRPATTSLGRFALRGCPGETEVAGASVDGAAAIAVDGRSVGPIFETMSH